MKAQEDIERQLAEAQAAWETSPPPALWERLEQRLDNGTAISPSPSRHWPFRIVVVLLLGIVGAGLWWLLPDSNASLSTGKASAPRQAGAASPLDDTQDRSLASQFDNQFGTGPKPISLSGPESDRKELVTNSRVDAFGPQYGGGNQRMQEPGDLHLRPRSDQGGSDAFGHPTGLSLDANSIATAPQNFYPSAAPWVNGRQMVVRNGVGNPIDTVSSVSNFGPIAMSNTSSYLQLNVASNQMNYQMASPVARAENQQNLQHFKWLLGSWKTQGASAGAMEDWRQKDDFTMVGRGYFVVNGDTIVTEEMRIEQRGPDVYFIILKDQNHRMMKFKLRSSQPNELIFEKAASTSDEELVLRNRPATDELERILQKQPSTNQATEQIAPQKTEARVMKRSVHR